MRSSITSAILSVGAMLGLNRPSHPSHFNPNARWRQSEALKKFHLDRAVAKRARKGEINRQRVICGEMYPLHAPEPHTINDGEFRDPTGKLTSKADLIALAETRHVKVYPSWTRDKIVEALNAAL